METSKWTQEGYEKVRKMFNILINLFDVNLAQGELIIILDTSIPSTTSLSSFRLWTAGPWL